MSWSMHGQGKALQVRTDFEAGAKQRETHLKGNELQLFELAMAQVQLALSNLADDHPVTVQASGSASWKAADASDQVNTLKVEIIPFPGWS